MTLFDLAEAEKRKEVGMQTAASRRAALLAIAQDCAFRIAASRRAALLAIAQDCAFRIAMEYGFCDSDMVAEAMLALGHNYDDLQNAAGSVFRARKKFWKWEWTGEVCKSQRPSTHARIIRKWRLVRCES